MSGQWGSPNLIVPNWTGFTWREQKKVNVEVFEL